MLIVAGLNAPPKWVKKTRFEHENLSGMAKFHFGHLVEVTLMFVPRPDVCESCWSKHHREGPEDAESSRVERSSADRF
jgi:hypothetical protein